MSRGDCPENIFLDDVDRQDFLKTLAEACQKTGWQGSRLLSHEQPLPRGARNPNANLVPGMAGTRAPMPSVSTLSIKEIAARIHLGTSKSANVRLHAALVGNSHHTFKPVWRYEQHRAMLWADPFKRTYDAANGGVLRVSPVTSRRRRRIQLRRHDADDFALFNISLRSCSFGFSIPKHHRHDGRSSHRIAQSIARMKIRRPADRTTIQPIPRRVGCLLALAAWPLNNAGFRRRSASKNRAMNWSMRSPSLREPMHFKTD